MPVTPPVMALGLDVPNPTLSIPGRTAGLAGGWTKTANISAAGYYTGSPSRGHARHQYAAVTGTNESEYLRSGPCPPGQLCANVWFNVQAWILLKTAGLGSAAGDSKIRIYVEWYNSSNTVVLSGELLSGGNPIQANYSSWTLWKGAGSYQPPAGAAYAKISIRLQRISTGQDISAEFAFADAGTYDGSAMEYVFASYARHPGTFAALQLPRQPVGPASLPAPRFLDRDRFPLPYRIELACSGIVATMNDALEYLYRMNGGRCSEGSTGNPAGGYWPIIIEGGNDVLPIVGLYDFEDPSFPMRPSPELDWVDFASPRFSGSMTARERL